MQKVKFERGMLYRRNEAGHWIPQTFTIERHYHDNRISSITGGQAFAIIFRNSGIERVRPSAQIGMNLG